MFYQWDSRVSEMLECSPERDDFSEIAGALHDTHVYRDAMGKWYKSEPADVHELPASEARVDERSGVVYAASDAPTIVEKE